MSYTLGDAARATGLNKSTILKAIHTGEVSGVKNVHGQWCIEPCGLHLFGQWRGQRGATLTSRAAATLEPVPAPAGP